MSDIYVECEVSPNVWDIVDSDDLSDSEGRLSAFIKLGIPQKMLEDSKWVLNHDYSTGRKAIRFI